MKLLPSTDGEDFNNNQQQTGGDGDGSHAAVASLSIFSRRCRLPQQLARGNGIMGFAVPLWPAFLEG